MPSTSKAQHRLMAAVAHNPSFAKKVGIPQSVGRDFTEADKGRKFAKGGDMKESKEMMKKEVAFMKKKGAPKSMIKHEEKEAKGYAKGGFTRAADGVAQKGKTKAQRFLGGGMLGDAPQAKPMQTMPSSVGRPVGMAGPQAMTPMPNDPGMAQPTAQQALQSTARPPVNQRIDSMLNQMSAQRQLDNQMAAKMQAKQQLTELMAAKNKAKPAPAPYQKPAAPYMNNYGNPGGPVMRRKTGGTVNTFAKGGSIDGCATKGKTKGRYI